MPLHTARTGTTPSTMAFIHYVTPIHLGFGTTRGGCRAVPAEST